MEWSREVARILLALTVVLLPLGSVASAGSKEDVSAATSEWGRVLGEDDPDKLLPLYADDAVLWGTLSPMVRSDRAALRDYFVTAFRVLSGLKVTFSTWCLAEVFSDVTHSAGRCEQGSIVGIALWVITLRRTRQQYKWRANVCDCCVCD